MTKEGVASVCLLTLSVIAVVMTANTIRTTFPTTQGREPRRIQYESRWRQFAKGHSLGPANARIVITEFGDFQCPYCRKLALTLDSVRQRNPTDVRVVFRHYPLGTIHPFAKEAAIAAECAAAQGKFAEYHDVLFNDQLSIGHSSWVDFGRRANLPSLPIFAKCLDGNEARRHVDDDVRAGNELGVAGTPTVLVNGRRIPGTPSPAILDSLVRLARRESVLQ